MLSTIAQALRLSLDNDLANFNASGNVNLELAFLVQIVRLLRGKHPQVVETPMTGWSPDGKTWLPSEPGTFTPQDGSKGQK